MFFRDNASKKSLIRLFFRKIWVVTYQNVTDSVAVILLTIYATGIPAPVSVKSPFLDEQAEFGKYSLRHRKCGVRGFIHELFVSKPERARYERVRAFDTNNE